jgi:hypothetical protein
MRWKNKMKLKKIEEVYNLVDDYNNEFTIVKDFNNKLFIYNEMGGVVEGEEKKTIIMFFNGLLKKEVKK